MQFSYIPVFKANEWPSRSDNSPWMQTPVGVGQLHPIWKREMNIQVQIPLIDVESVQIVLESQSLVFDVFDQQMFGAVPYAVE